MPIPKLPENIKPTSPVFANNFEYIELPFPVLRLSWHNGNAHAIGSKLENPAAYYGGFHRGADDVQADLVDLQMTAPPSYLKEAVWVNDNNENYKAFSCRNLWCAPILAKDDWWEDKKNPGKTKHRLDFLVYLADRVNQKPIAWGLGVITAYGFSASRIRAAFQKFAQDTQDARKQWGNNINPMFLWHCVGTFGDERVFEKVGESSIVPCQVNLPKNGWTDELLSSMFVGEEIAALVCQYQIEAKEWSEDMNSTRQNAKKASAPESANETVQIGAPIPENFSEQLNDPFAG